jgi:hypothetical protein
MKKWLCFLLAFGLMSTPVFAADDDDEDEDEEEEEAPKKKAAPPPKKVNKSSGTSRMGLAISFSGEQGAISFVYDLGGGLELGLGLGLHRVHYAEIPGAPEQPEPLQMLIVIPSISYSLGSGLLEYGLGVDAGIIMEPMNGDGTDGGMSMNIFPYFYSKAELVKNVALKLSAGINVYKPSGEEGRGETRNMVFDLTAQGTVIFYFL